MFLIIILCFIIYLLNDFIYFSSLSLLFYYIELCCFDCFVFLGGGIFLCVNVPYNAILYGSNMHFF